MHRKDEEEMNIFDFFLLIGNGRSGEQQEDEMQILENRDKQQFQSTINILKLKT